MVKILSICNHGETDNYTINQNYIIISDLMHKPFGRQVIIVTTSIKSFVS